MPDQSLKAGFSEVDITPPNDLSLAGRFFPRPIQGVLDPLLVHVMVLESENTQVVLVSCDLLVFPRRMVVDIRRNIEDELGIPATNIAVFATHTHTGPYTCEIFGNAPDADYILTLQQKITEAVRLAYHQLEPVELGVASAFEENISFNRRYVMKDGLVRTHPPRGSIKLSHVEGPMDPEVGVICLRSRNGRVVGYFVNFACHPNVVGGNQISADFPGALSRALKRNEGEECITLFSNGASGDICQIDVNNPNKEDKGYAWAEKMGEILADDVASTLLEMTFSHTGKLVISSSILSVPIRDPNQTPYHGTMFSGPTLEEIDKLYYREQDELRRQVREHPNVEIEIQVIRISNVALVMIPAELFVEFGLDLKLRSPFKPTYVASMANGSIGYIPTPYALSSEAATKYVLVLLASWYPTQGIRSLPRLLQS